MCMPTLHSDIATWRLALVGMYTSCHPNPTPLAQGVALSMRMADALTFWMCAQIQGRESKARGKGRVSMYDGTCC